MWFLSEIVQEFPELKGTIDGELPEIDGLTQEQNTDMLRELVFNGYIPTDEERLLLERDDELKKVSPPDLVTFIETVSPDLATKPKCGVVSSQPPASPHVIVREHPDTILLDCEDHFVCDSVDIDRDFNDPIFPDLAKKAKCGVAPTGPPSCPHPPVRKIPEFLHFDNLYILDDNVGPLPDSPNLAKKPKCGVVEFQPPSSPHLCDREVRNIFLEDCAGSLNADDDYPDTERVDTTHGSSPDDYIFGAPYCDPFDSDLDYTLRWDSNQHFGIIGDKTIPGIFREFVDIGGVDEEVGDVYSSNWNCALKVRVVMVRLLLFLFTTRGINTWLTSLIRETFTTDFSYRQFVDELLTPGVS